MSGVGSRETGLDSLFAPKPVGPGFEPGLGQSAKLAGAPKPLCLSDSERELHVNTHDLQTRVKGLQTSPTTNVPRSQLYTQTHSQSRVADCSIDAPHMMIHTCTHEYAEMWLINLASLDALGSCVCMSCCSTDL